MRKWLLLADVFSAKIVLWAVVGGRFRDIEFQEMTDEEHLYFWDRYSRLAKIYRSHGRSTKAAWCAQRAAEHYDATDGGPPYAAAMARPRPRPYLLVDATSRREGHSAINRESAHAPN
jgi:hypothetical protein